VYIETPGSSPDIVMENVDQPFILQDEILGIKEHKGKVDKVKAENKEQETLHKWFSTVVAKLEDATTSRRTPNLKKMDFLSAMTNAQEHDLNVVVKGEAVAYAEIPPGHVVDQDPPPGTMMEKGSQIQVILSKRPSLVQ
jgi:hypothetical protein